MTYHPKSDFLRVMFERGFVADCTDYQALDEALVKGVVPAYIGYDATAASLHVGHLMNIMVLRWLQKTGHKPITLMGGGTTKVGDPSFRSEERPLLTPAKIDENIAGLKKVFAQYLSYGDGPTDAIMLNNAEWLDSLNYLDFLRDIGRHFSVNQMCIRDSARIVYASKERVAAGEVTTYEDLADPKWKGRICTRSGTNDYNVALTAAVLAHHDACLLDTPRCV